MYCYMLLEVYKKKLYLNASGILNVLVIGDSEHGTVSHVD